MNQNQFNRIFSVIRQTGDRFVVADNKSDEVFVVMPFDDYEFLAGYAGRAAGEPVESIAEPDDVDFDRPSGEARHLSEQELLEKINNDIADWRQEQKKKEEEDNSDEDGSEKAEFSQKKDSGMTPLSAVLKDEKFINGDFDESERSHPNLGPVEDLRDVPEERAQEEKFYLEPVE